MRLKSAEEMAHFDELEKSYQEQIANLQRQLTLTNFDLVRQTVISEKLAVKLQESQRQAYENQKWAWKLVRHVHRLRDMLQSVNLWRQEAVRWWHQARDETNKFAAEAAELRKQVIDLEAKLYRSGSPERNTRS